MMDKSLYQAARESSNALFKNRLVLPVGLAIATVASEGQVFKLADLREELGGRAAANSIRDALARIEGCNAVRQLASLGPPHPDIWERRPHPFWAFTENWAGYLASAPQKKVKK